MPVVVDANVFIVLTSVDDRYPIAQRRVQQWTDSSEVIHAPSLLTYEFANGFTRLVASGAVTPEQVDGAWRTLLALNITYHPLLEDGARVVAIARRLRRQNAYDAAYLALAERLNADVWTFDGPLYRNAVGLGFPVHLLK